MDVSTILGFCGVGITFCGVVAKYYIEKGEQKEYFNKKIDLLNKEISDLKIENEKVKGELKTVKQVHDVFNKNVLSNLPALFEALKHKTND